MKKMKSMKRMAVLAGILFGHIFLFSGCAVGPKYVYVKQQDSATMEAYVTPRQREGDGTCDIRIARIDGLVANFTASHPGSNSYKSAPLYLSSGPHVLDLVISQIDVIYGTHSGNSAGIVGENTAGSEPTFTAEFAANHIYRLAAYLNGKTIDLALWDETGGPATRSRAASWTLGSNAAFFEQ